MIDFNNINKCLIIAEAGVNHNGSIKIAKELCLEAKNSGADVIKFQTWITDKIITRTVKQASYQIKNTGRNISQYEMLKELELTFDEFREIKQYCDNIGIKFCSTADEAESLDFLIDIGVPFIKVGSGDICNVPFLRYIGGKGLPVIISTGMSSLSDVEMSIDALKYGGTKQIIVLHCTTSYPCPFMDVNLKAMDTLKNAFKYDVGYSDHTVGIEAAVAAVARGAKVIEKHFTLNRNLEGPDHNASTEPLEFKKMVEAIRNVEISLGTGNKTPTSGEKEISKVVMKRIIANRKIKKGKIIEEEDLCVKRSDNGIPVKYWDMVVGMISPRNFYKDDGIEI